MVIWKIFSFVLLVLILTNGNMPSSNQRRISLHIDRVLLALLSLEIYEAKKKAIPTMLIIFGEAIPTMSSMIYVSVIFPGEVPSQYVTALSKFVDDLVGCDFKVDVMHINLKLLLILVALVLFEDNPIIDFTLVRVILLFDTKSTIGPALWRRIRGLPFELLLPDILRGFVFISDRRLRSMIYRTVRFLVKRPLVVTV